MGMMALAGGLQGLGRGIVKNSENRREERVMKEKIDYTALKEEQLARIRGEIQADNIEFEQGHIAGREFQRDARTSAEQRRQEEFEAEQKEKQRQNNLEVARVNQTGRGSSSAESRFKFLNASGGEAAGFADLTKAIDQKTQTTLIQEGDKFKLSGWNPDNPPPPPTEAMERQLVEDMDKYGEEYAYTFADYYGYLPAAAVRKMTPWYSPNQK